jgi:glycosyltransferase involved in cell wall biosynthesis
MHESATRVLAVIDGLRLGGAEKMLVNLVNRMDKGRFHVTVTPLSRPIPLAADMAPEVEVIALPRRWRYDLGPVRQLQRLIEERRIDAVLCFSLYSFFFARLAVGMLRQSPAVFISIHSAQLFNLPRHLQYFLYARLLNGTEQFIAVCDAQADYWAKAYLIPRSRFVTVYNGVDVQFFKPADDLQGRRALRAQWGIPEEAFVIVQVANLTPHKRHEDALLALRYLLDAAPECDPYLALVGGGAPEREIQLRNMAESLELSERVLFCGMQCDVRPFHSVADIFTLTSVRENFSVAALEAMAMGLPCVITDIGGAREMITDGVNGYVAPPLKPREMGERWLSCLDHAGQFDRWAIRRRACERFDIDVCVRNYEAIIGTKS